MPAKVDMDPVYQRRLEELRDAAAAEYAARAVGGRAVWLRPGDWNGAVHDFVGMEVPFSRLAANDDFVDAVKDQNSPGVPGDLISSTTMIEYLACMERAFRLRHTMQRPRAMAHTIGRKLGHGNNAGPFIQNALEYVRALIQQSKVAP